VELSRLRRIVRARWWVITVMGLLGLGAAVAYTNYQNENIEPRHRAVATIEFIVAETDEPATPTPSRNAPTGGGGAAADLVETAEEAALEINALLLEQPNISLRADTENGTLEFSATAPSADLAEEIVVEMRDKYVAVDPTAVDVDAEIATLIDEAMVLQSQLDELEPPPEPEAPEVPVAAQARIDVLESQIGSAIGDVADLEDELEAAEGDEAKAEIQAQIEAIVTRVTELRQEVADLTPDEPEPVEFELSPGEQLQQTAAEARLTAISAEYQEFLDIEKSGDRIDLPEIMLLDETPAQADLILGGLIGLIAGAIAGLVVLVLIDRVQGTVWTPRDMAQVPTLAEVPQHGSRVELRPRRYQAVRQKGVQSVRSAVLGLYHAAGPTTIGFTSLGTSEESTSEFVLDIARSLAGVGRSVLLIDGQLLALPALRDDLSGGSTLADLVVQDTDDVVLSRKMAHVLDACVQLAPNLAVLPGDPGSVDAVDILASKSFRTLTQRAQDDFDVVMVVGPSALSPFAYVMTGLVSAYVVVTTVGKTRQAQIAQLATQFAGSRSRLIGAVLLGIKPRRGWVPASDLSRAAAEQAAAAAAASTEPVEVVGEVEGEQGLLDRLGQSLASLAGDKPDQ
jgi:Mrp family chromosome partitioning ATPase